MTPAARLHAAIELLDAIIAAAREGGAAADTLIARYFAARRYAGAKDRRAVRDLVYDVIRGLGERPPSGRAAVIGHARAHRPEWLDLFGQGPHAPAPLDAQEPAAEPGFAPAWLVERLRARFGAATDGELRALLLRAPLDVRINTLRFDQLMPGGGDANAATAHPPGDACPAWLREQVRAAHPAFTPTPYAPLGLRVPEGFAIENSDLFRVGRIEVQDEGSQLACLAVEARPGQHVIDLCAGAGGKTLALAAAMANRGQIVACDTDRARLSRLAPRAARAGATIIETRLLDPQREADRLSDIMHAADVVLVDAPCSGTGTWRRNPEARWRLTPERLARFTAAQAHILDVAAGLVRPGGRLVYVVCSLLPEEGEAQIAAFRQRHARFAPAPFVLPTEPAAVTSTLLTPARHGCDGFFIAALSSF